MPITRRAAIASLIIFGAFLIHNVNALYIEPNILGFKDPRVHAALNCASKGCPRLPQVAFDPEKLDQQLDLGMTEFVGESRNVTVDAAAKTVTLSKILDWFEKDFVGYEKAKGTADPNQIDYVNRYRGALPKIPRDYKIKFFEYDKSVNKQ